MAKRTATLTPLSIVTAAGEDAWRSADPLLFALLFGSTTEVFCTPAMKKKSTSGGLSARMCEMAPKKNTAIDGSIDPDGLTDSQTRKSTSRNICISLTPSFQLHLHDSLSLKTTRRCGGCARSDSLVYAPANSILTLMTGLVGVEAALPLTLLERWWLPPCDSSHPLAQKWR
jgi:hypothetical protein